LALTRGPVEHRPDDILTPFVLGEVGNEDVDWRSCADGTPDRTDQMGSLSRFDTIEHHEQVEVAVRTFVATRYRPEEHDPLWRHLPNDVIDGDR
jgi:hypothetical protein